MMVRVILLEVHHNFFTFFKLDQFVVNEVEVSKDIFNYASSEQRRGRFELIDHAEVPKEGESAGLVEGEAALAEVLGFVAEEDHRYYFDYRIIRHILLPRHSFIIQLLQLQHVILHSHRQKHQMPILPLNYHARFPFINLCNTQHSHIRLERHNLKICNRMSMSMSINITHTPICILKPFFMHLYIFQMSQIRHQ